MPSLLFLVLFIAIFCLSGHGVHAFGAGNIPSFAFMEGKAFRHGDIEDALADLIKRTGGGLALTSLLSKGAKFNGLDIKRVYFGNWLRDYSQAMDIAALKKLPQQTIINLLMVLGFMAHGYATNEFEVTPERLGVYLPVEHIDNPKGYGEGEDPRQYHPNLRPPVDPRELEIDPRTGMKNYIGNEQGHWDTSRAHVRRILEKCIHLGRQHRSKGQKADEYEAYRLLGTALHTLEDFTAHSNWCELTLHQMGHTDVFLHVGDQVRIQAPNGKWVAPIVTGTFGSNDFFHSILGEAGDHISSATVTDINVKVASARSAAAAQSQSTRGGASSGGGPGDVLKTLFSSLPGGMGSDMARDMGMMEGLRSSAGVSGGGGFGGGGFGTRDGGPGGYPGGGPPGYGGGYGAPQIPMQGVPGGGKKPEEMSPQELHTVLWEVLKWRDGVVKKISKTIEKIPGLGPLLDKITDSIAVYVLTTLDPFLKPILQSATGGLQAASGEVINSHDQYEVFNDPRASDPTHSFLSKDHFGLILNEPAGKIAKVVVANTVILIAKAWEDNSMNPHNVIEEILQCLFHPDFHNPNSKVQREMMQSMHDWVNRLGAKQHQLLQRLSKNAVRNHENNRPSEGSETWEPDSHWNPNASHGAGGGGLGGIQGFGGFQPGSGGGGSGGLMGLVGKFGQGGGGFGQGRDVSGHGGHYAPPQMAHSVSQPSSYAPPPGPPPMAHSLSQSSAYSSPPRSSSSSYAPPAGPPPGSHGHSSWSPPPSFPGAAPPSPPFHSGYAPSYAAPPPPGGGAPGFPDYGQGGGYGGGGFGFPGAPGEGAPPAFPGAAPGFPGAPGGGGFLEHGQGGHGHHQHGQGGYGGW